MEENKNSKNEEVIKKEDNKGTNLFKSCVVFDNKNLIRKNNEGILTEEKRQKSIKKEFSNDNDNDLNKIIGKKEKLKLKKISSIKETSVKKDNEIVKNDSNKLNKEYIDINKIEENNFISSEKNVPQNTMNNINVINYNKSVNITNNNPTYFNNNNNNNNIPQNKINEIPYQLGNGYKFTIDSYIQQKNNSKPKNNINFIKKLNTKGKDKENFEDIDIDKLLQNLKGNKTKPEIKKEIKPEIFNIKKENNSSIKPIKNPEEYININEIIIKKDKEELNEKTEIKEKPIKRKSTNLKSSMIENFDIKIYKNLPKEISFPIDLTNLTIKNKFNKFLLDKLKATLNDINKNDIIESTKKLELILYYLNQIKNN